MLMNTNATNTNAEQNHGRVRFQTFFFSWAVKFDHGEDEQKRRLIILGSDRSVWWRLSISYTDSSPVSARIVMFSSQGHDLRQDHVSMRLFTWTNINTESECMHITLNARVCGSSCHHARVWHAMNALLACPSMSWGRTDSGHQQLLTRLRHDRV